MERRNKIHRGKPKRNSICNTSHNRPGPATMERPRFKRKMSLKFPDQRIYGLGRGGPFHEKPIQIERNAHRLARIRNYAHADRSRRMAIRTKQGLTGAITQTLGKWKTRKLEESLKKLQEAADNNDMLPIWDFQIKLRMNKTKNRVEIKKKWHRTPRAR